MFSGWVIAEGEPYLYDDAGNGYHIDEIRAIFFNRQLIQSLTGTPHNPQIASLKRHLEEKINAVELPSVTINWGDGDEKTYRHPKSG